MIAKMNGAERELKSQRGEKKKTGTKLQFDNKKMKMLLIFHILDVCVQNSCSNWEKGVKIIESARTDRKTKSSHIL